MRSPALRPVLVALALCTAPAALAGTGKVDVCHVTPSTPSILRISESALPAHLRHGDHAVAAEVCNGVDDDCDGVIDDGAAATRWYADADGDGEGDPSVSADACAAPAGYVATATDCDDGDAAIGAGATEACDGLDNDCDGATDEAGATGALTFYADADADGHGDPTDTVTTCDLPAGYVDLDDDCNDADAAVSPDADEVCGGEDEDCDGVVDEDDAIDAVAWHADADADGFGDAAASTLACTAPAGAVADGSDCDDARDDVNPDGAEVCNAVDDDCNGAVDDAAMCSERYFGSVSEEGISWYDAELACEAMNMHLVVIDGAEDEQAVLSMFGTTGGFWIGANDSTGDFAWITGAAFPTTPSWATDEPTMDATANCLVSQYAGGWADYDCTDDTVITDFLCEADDVTDLDEDGDGVTPAGGDCDDTYAFTFPTAAEGCDGRDNDCDGSIDEDFEHVAINFYIDLDGDGYGVTELVTYVCDGEDPPATILDPLAPYGGDCDDADASVYPDHDDVCSDGIDDNCNGLVDEDCATP